MTASYNHQIDRPAHQRRCRAALELLATPGPLLPLERRRVDPRTGAVTVRISSGAWIGID